MKAARVNIPNAVASAAHLALNKTLVSRPLEQDTFLPIANTAIMPACMAKVAAKLYAGPVGRAPWKIANRTTVFRQDIATAEMGLIMRRATMMGISHIW